MLCCIYVAIHATLQQPRNDCCGLRALLAAVLQSRPYCVQSAKHALPGLDVLFMFHRAVSGFAQVYNTSDTKLTQLLAPEIDGQL